VTVNIDPTPEQKLLAETVTRLLADEYSPATRLQLLNSPAAWSREMWRHYAELGLLGLPFEERFGGAGMGVDELMVVMECFGRALVLEPYIASVLLAGSLVARAGSEEQKQKLLPGLIAGEVLLAFASTEACSRWSLSDIRSTVGPDRTLSGAKIVVLGGDTADYFVVSARSLDGRVGLYLVDGTDARVRRDAYRMQDGLSGADVVFDEVPSTELGVGTDCLDVMQSVLDVATGALCAEALGAMDRMLWLTVDYLKTRVQFGQPLSSFQALQHRAADMYVALEQARSATLLARLASANSDVEEGRRTVRAAKAQVDLSARHIAQEAIQLHGAMGMTMECQVGHYAKRTTAIAKTFADTDWLIEQVGLGPGLIPAA
jgi:alkylation response protein AidB-like acyl-CoA dehydrogenase